MKQECHRNSSCPVSVGWGTPSGCTYTTRELSRKLRDILRAVSQEFIDLIAGSSVTIPDLTGLSTVDVDNTMGDYIDDID